MKYDNIEVTVGAVPPRRIPISDTEAITIVKPNQIKRVKHRWKYLVGDEWISQSELVALAKRMKEKGA